MSRCRARAWGIAGPRCRLAVLAAAVAVSGAMVFVTAFSAAADAQPPKYDLVLRGGHVVDGTGNPWFAGDVAIDGDRIAAVGRIAAGEGKREFDATGLVVAPGFIDMHSHSDYALLQDGRAESKIRQGVTTEVLGEGTSAGPGGAAQVTNEDTIGGGRSYRRYATLGDYFRQLEKTRASVNVASYVGIDNIWQAVMGASHERPTAEQFAAMKKLVRAAMEDGAMGLSTMMAMPPGGLAATDDLVALCEPVAEVGGIYSSHIRNEGTGVFEAVKEAIAVGERAGVRVDIIHLKIADQQYWGRMGEIVKLIEDARSRGVDVQANVYPYTRGNNDLVSIIPPWAHEGGKEKLLTRLADPQEREKMKRDIRGGIDGWYNHFTAVGGDWSRMLVSGNCPYAGLTMDRVMALRGASQAEKPDAKAGGKRDDLDMLFDLLIEQKGTVPTVYAHHTEEDMNLAMSQPWCSIGSDGSALAIEGPLRSGNPHPRNFGTFPRVLGVYVRERGVLRLEDAVRKMTSLSAAKIGIRDRGVIRVGAAADVTVFDAAKVIDKATYTEPFAYGEGIELVAVNGQVVLERGKHTGAKPGKVLRRDGTRG
ncbi:MAG: D-aminoacylase [Pirellulales bacterium]